MEMPEVMWLQATLVEHACGLAKCHWACRGAPVGSLTEPLVDAEPHKLTITASDPNTGQRYRITITTRDLLLDYMGLGDE